MWNDSKNRPRSTRSRSKDSEIYCFIRYSLRQQRVQKYTLTTQTVGFLWINIYLIWVLVHTHLFQYFLNTIHITINVPKHHFTQAKQRIENEEDFFGFASSQLESMRQRNINALREGSYSPAFPGRKSSMPIMKSSKYYLWKWRKKNVSKCVFQSFLFIIKVLNFLPSAKWLSSRKMPYKLWPIANLYLAWFVDRFCKLLLQHIEDLKVDWSRINFTVWYVKNKHRVECLFTGFLSPIRRWRRNPEGANILWCLYMSF